MSEPLQRQDDSRSGPQWLQQAWVRALAALILILLLGAIFNADGTFFKFDTHRDMFRYISRWGILACGMTLVIITAGIDLSVGRVLGLSAVVFSLMTIHWGWSPWLAIPATMLVGMGCGLLSGSLISVFRIQPFIATLAMWSFAYGLSRYVSGGQKVSTAVPQIAPNGAVDYTYVDPPAVFDVLNAKVLGENVAVMTLLWLVCVAFCWILLSRLRWGRYIYAVGGNEESARLSGIPVKAVKLMVYALSGVFAAVAGILQAADEYQGDPEAGVMFELHAIAIVVIGGTNLMGGRGGIQLTLLGALTYGYLDKLLSINAVPEAWRLMLTGVIIVAAVLFQKSKK